MNSLKTVLCAIVLAVSVSARAAESIAVAVAANVKPAFEELAAAFTAETGIEVKRIGGSSGKITAQVKAGAPYDVFLSADTEYPETLRKEGYAASEPKVYAYGSLVLWTVNDLDLGKGVALLAEDIVKKVAIPNPKLAPYGREAVRAMAHARVYDAVEPKLVYAESISQATQYAESKSVDIGFTAKSMVLAPELRGKGKWMEVPPDTYQPIAQAAVVLKHGQETNAKAARKFFDFLYGEKARAIFTRFGYLTVSPPP